jgi:hypothetical protein
MLDVVEVEIFVGRRFRCRSDRLAPGGHDGLWLSLTGGQPEGNEENNYSFEFQFDA